MEISFLFVRWYQHSSPVRIGFFILPFISLLFVTTERRSFISLLLLIFFKLPVCQRPTFLVIFFGIHFTFNQPTESS